MILRRRSGGLSDELAALVPPIVPRWAAMGVAEQEKLLADTDHLLRAKRWEAARGFELTDQMRVVVAAGAAVLVVGLHVDAYRRVRSIILHPSGVWRSGPRPGPAAGVVVDGPVALTGEAAIGEGPLLIAWDRALADARRPHWGRNVVFHEFAHKLDMLDGTIDGMPPLPGDDARRSWQRTFDDALERVRQGQHRDVIDDYAGASPIELFAVATEVFFTRPDRLVDTMADVYQALRAFYRQDPITGRERDVAPVLQP